jgi:hypothetical protein
MVSDPADSKAVPRPDGSLRAELVDWLTQWYGEDVPDDALNTLLALVTAHTAALQRALDQTERRARLYERRLEDLQGSGGITPHVFQVIRATLEAGRRLDAAAGERS